MGIGGAVLYSVALIVFREMMYVGVLVMRLLHWTGRAFFDGSAQCGASLGNSQLFHGPLGHR